MGTFIRSDFTSTDANAPVLAEVVPPVEPPIDPPVEPPIDPPVEPPVDTAIARDSFERPDNATAGTTEVGSYTWEHKASTWHVAGGVLSSGDTSSGTPADCWINPGVANGVLTAEILSVGAKDHTGIVFRKADVGHTALVYYAQNTSYKLAIRTGGDAFTVITRTGASVAFKAGQVATVRIEGDRIVCAVDGVVTHDVVDATYNTQTGVGFSTRLATAADPSKVGSFSFLPL